MILWWLLFLVVCPNTALNYVQLILTAFTHHSMLNHFSPADFIDFEEVGHGFSGFVLKSKLGQDGPLVARKIIHETRRKRAEMPTSLSPAEREFEVYSRVARHGGSSFIVNCLGLMKEGAKGHLHGGLVLEFMDLGSLHDLLLRRPGHPLPESIILTVAHSLFSACHLLHSFGLLHRDLKPSNILFNSRGQVKICDFGEAAGLDECADSSLSQCGGGSLAYMAPERLSGQPHGPAADVWSIGVVLLEMVQGHFPFQNTAQVGSCSSFSDHDCSMIELWEIIMDEATFPPLINQTHYSPALTALISACLQRNSEKRPHIKDLLTSQIFDSQAEPSELLSLLIN